ncbi:hypothetical protein CW304_26450 [Bacillus sp. UFRGS-B20]|nr:hypothetical protein CW304_26450 [Bacillus sp. UFRGS-B20]
MVSVFQSIPFYIHDCISCFFLRNTVTLYGYHLLCNSELALKNRLKMCELLMFRLSFVMLVQSYQCTFTLHVLDQGFVLVLCFASIFYIYHVCLRRVIVVS